MDYTTTTTILIAGIIISKTIIAILIWYLVKINRQLKNDKDILALKSAELKKAEDFKLKIIAIATHDLRSPFVSAKLLLDNLDFSKIRPDEMTSLLTELKNQNTTSQKTVDDILLWTASQLKQSNQIRTSFNVKQKIIEAIDLFLPLLQQKGIAVVNKVPDNINTDGSQDSFNIIFRNILQNAIKFSPKNNTITIDFTKGDYPLASISIKDNGIGISSQIIKSINNGSELDTDQIQKGNGMRLGLSLSHMLATQMGWQIKAAENIKQGSLVSLNLPIIYK